MEEKYIYVSQEDGWQKGHSPSILRSGGVGPCIVIAAYDFRTTSGYMIHEPDFPINKTLEPFIEVLQEDYGRLDELSLYITGGAADLDADKQHKKDVAENKRHVESIVLARFNPEQVILDWLEDGWMTELSLDTFDGTFDTDPECLDNLVTAHFG